jgi:hypothetical protein
MRIKAADDRQPDIVVLERLLDRKDVPQATRKRIESEIRQIQAGITGERDATYIIDLYYGRSPNWAVIHDLRIEVGGHAAQMDHVIINRLAQVWVCESKHFAEGVSVNEYGEWSRWWRGRQEGIPSPIEQNRRHILLLQRAFDDGLVSAPKRLGLVRWKPEVKSLVLVSDNARIGRPRRKVDGLDDVVKAEQLKRKLEEGFDKASAISTFGLIGKEGLQAFARELAALHRPASFDWPARFGLAAGPSAAPSAFPAPSTARPSRGSGHKCASCAAPVSFAVVKFCWNNKARFGDRILCMDCQKAVAPEFSGPPRGSPDAGP